MKKIFTPFIIILVLFLCFSLGACNLWVDEDDFATTLKEEYEGNNVNMPTISDYVVDDNFDLNLVKFAFFSPSTGWTYDVENAPFDENRPTFIYAHGQGGDCPMSTPEDIYNLGYNVINFLWGTFSNDDLFSIEYKIWDNIQRFVLDENGKDVIHESDKFNCTVPELYVARYCDFFSLHPNYNKPIRFIGHSYGSQLTMATSAYITKLFKDGRLEARLFPERYTLLDPYFDNMDFTFDCKWLEQQLSSSSVGASSYCIDNILFPNNVAIEMLRTSPYVEMSIAMGTTTNENPADYFALIKNKLRVTELSNSSQIVSQSPNMFEGVGNCHSIATKFYFSGNASNSYYDEDGALIFGREVPASFVLATTGMHFDFTVSEKNYLDFQDMTYSRTITEKNADLTMLAGFVCFDENGNSVYDENAGYRLNGIKVELYDEQGILLDATYTSNGYYSFDVERGKNYSLEFSAPNYKTEKQTIEARYFVNTLDVALLGK